MPVYRLDLAYDGSGFHGYARQPDVRTVQGELEGALMRILGLRRSPATRVAGRTDAGVHARGQVVSLDLPQAVDADRLHRSLNSILSPEVVVRRLAEAPPGFDARRWARSRTYRYRILNAPLADPFLSPTSWHVAEPLSSSAMGAAAGHMVGSHDFASFCRAGPDQDTQREVSSARWDPEDELLIFEISAHAFCHQMVRSIVATCAAAGGGRLDPAEVPAILKARDRDAAHGAAPPHGLFLWSVEY